ncbi:MAG TPA: nucleoside recognition domain-containing protein [Syntrophorhabdaceae bacterium]|nr:nucleoside recognition domain-containing protein [Syntrophorhabdaceae bacterium]HOT42596.1 nucleoside recognition domain-containing protein [Syntrophorhabdaceae bacterium]HPC65677.1 nucleoside recognition domain-containing protein [Syntrophorhabdaceae bacterium]HQE79757.1 nucleoside recognition domain-containing protein [Syntrophorhabdaceae bacterium]HQH43463.1 nucleoside recognition domain-containing protein [Syntrophorhabdaceae bacterium]
MKEGAAVNLKKGLINGLSITLLMVKVIVPCYIIIEIIKHFGIIGIISEFFKPFMRFFGLPGEAALAIIAGYTINLYAAIAVISPLNLSSKDITIVALILGISHSLSVETPVTQKTGVNGWLLLVLRISLSLFAGAGLNLIWTLF